jgi:hypothetical protein
VEHRHIARTIDVNSLGGLLWAELCPLHKRYAGVLTPEPQRYLEVSSYRSKQVTMKSLGWVLIQCDQWPYKEEIWTWKQTLHYQRWCKDSGRMSSTSQECLRPPESKRAAWRDSSSWPPEWINTVNTLISDFGLQNCETKHSCCFRLPSWAHCYGSCSCKWKCAWSVLRQRMVPQILCVLASAICFVLLCYSSHRTLIQD